ncbi:helix-turn-helix transcriptional regulator [Acetobacterium wieringae]|uniref:HTH-type transcriptional regulator Xre n=1 Tax=Acetobacterium wieringae TaxID=52694 RepID=A0A1F2PCK3_9FIRM|nr:helix-turn-helix transcriptional regulator [Acetobacterium wieringae]OFV69139.1 HTH-type transcriptional regulator Xre [Acetobacterium wieringae]
MENVIIAKRLVELRGVRTQKEVAESLGISISALSMYEIGQRIPRDEVKIKIAKYYGKSVQDIFFKQ